MLKALLAGAAVTFVIAAGPALAQSIVPPPPGAPLPMGPALYPIQPAPMAPALQPISPVPMRPIITEVVPSEPVTPEDRAAVRRDWNEMAREWEMRQRTGYVQPPPALIPAPSAPPVLAAPIFAPPPAGTYGGYDPRIAPAPLPPKPMPGGSALEVLPQEPVTPAERAQVRRDWEAMAREWEMRQRGGYAPPAGALQPLPYQR